MHVHPIGKQLLVELSSEFDNDIQDEEYDYGEQEQIANVVVVAAFP